MRSTNAIRSGMVGKRRGPIIVIFAAVLALQACAVSCRPRDVPPAALPVAAASDLQAVGPRLAEAFRQETGIPVEFSFGSTGLLARQIEQGAPFGVFLSADMETPLQLEAKGLLAVSPACFATGRLALWQRADCPVALEQVSDLSRPDIKRIGIANPNHAPYGRAAVDLLIRAGIEPVVRDKLVPAENVRQAQLYAQSGNVDVAIIALPLCVPGEGMWRAIDPAAHAPIRQAVSIIAAHPRLPESQKFAAFMLGERARLILREAGFGPADSERP